MASKYKIFGFLIIFLMGALISIGIQATAQLVEEYPMPELKGTILQTKYATSTLTYEEILIIEQKNDNEKILNRLDKISYILNEIYKK